MLGLLNRVILFLPDVSERPAQLACSSCRREPGDNTLICCWHLLLPNLCLHCTENRLPGARLHFSSALWHRWQRTPPQSLPHSATHPCLLHCTAVLQKTFLETSMAQELLELGVGVLIIMFPVADPQHS